MKLKKNQLVVFPDGHKEGYLEAFWSERHKAFRSVRIAEDGQSVEQFSNKIIEKKPSTKKAFIPSEKNCPVRLIVDHETEKSYAIEDGTNGLIGPGSKVYYKYIAKSICWIDESGNVYAPSWA